MLVAINSTGWLPASAAQGGSELSRWCPVAAIAGIGMKSQLKELARAGLKPVVLMVGETVFLVGLVVGVAAVGGVIGAPGCCGSTENGWEPSTPNWTQGG